MTWKLLIGVLLTTFLLLGCSSASEVSRSPAEETSTQAPTMTEAPPTVANQSPDNAPMETQPTTAPLSPASAPGNSSGVSSPSLAIQGVGQPREGGKLVVLFTDPPTLDPHLTTDSYSGALVNEVFGGLVSLTPDLEVVGDLAEDGWDFSPDGTVYTFHLRPNARFHDGKPVTAEDVRWSLERVTDPDTLSPVADLYLSDIVGVRAKLQGEADTISGVRVVDERTVEITIDAPKSYFVSKLTYPTAFVLDRENVESDPDQWLRHPNGTGPFKLAEYEVGEVLRLTRNENYHLEPAHLDEIEMILSGGSPMLMYENDEIDLTGVGLEDLERVQDPSNPLNAEVHKAPSSFHVSFIGLNVEQPPLDDLKVRQALSYAIDRESISTQVYQGAVVPALSILPPGFPGHSADVHTHEYDIEKAKQLLRESKYGDNLSAMPRITLSISGGFGADVPLDLQVILQSWETQLGIRADIEQTEWATFLQDLHQRRYQMFTLAWSADYPDPENYLDILFHSESDNSWTNYRNPQVDALLEQARVERDQDTRFELYHQVEQMILDDVPWIPLWNRGDQYVLVKPNVNNYYLTPMTIPKYRYIYLSAE